MRSFVHSLVTASTLLIITGCGGVKSIPSVAKKFEPGNFPNIQNSIYGAWKADQTETNAEGVNQQLNIFFNSAGEVGVQKVCTKWPDTVTVDATLTGFIGKDYFEVDTNFKDVKEGKGTVANCVIEVQKVQQPFQVNSNQLLLTGPKGQFYTYTRIQ